MWFNLFLQEVDDVTGNYVAPFLPVLNNPKRIIDKVAITTVYTEMNIFPHISE